MIDVEGVEGFYVCELSDQDKRKFSFILLPAEIVPETVFSQMVSGSTFCLGGTIYPIAPLTLYSYILNDGEFEGGFARFDEWSASDECVIDTLRPFPNSTEVAELLKSLDTMESPVLLISYDDYFLAEHIYRTNTEIDDVFIYFLNKCSIGGLPLVLL